MRPELPVVLATLAVLVSGCGGDTQETVTTDADAGELEVMCFPGGPTFPRSTLDDLEDAPGPDRDMSQALDAFLGGEEGAFWPQEGYRILHRDEGVLLVTEADGQLWFQSLERNGEEWRWSGSTATAACELRATVAEGFGPVTWRVESAPDPDATEFEVLAREVACASGRPVGDRLRGPQVEESEDEVTIGFIARSPEGDQECPGNPETSVIVRLDRPVGDRQLVDAFDLDAELRDFL